MIDEIVGVEPQPLIIRREIFHKSGNRHCAIDRIFGVPGQGFCTLFRPEEIHLASQVWPRSAFFGDQGIFLVPPQELQALLLILRHPICAATSAQGNQDRWHQCVPLAPGITSSRRVLQGLTRRTIFVHRPPKYGTASAYLKRDRSTQLNRCPDLPSAVRQSLRACHIAVQSRYLHRLQTL